MQNYLGWVRQLIQHYPDRDIPSLQGSDVLEFLKHLKNDRKLAGSTLNQATCSLRCLFRDHLGYRWKEWSQIKFTREEPLPHVLTRQEVALLLSSFRDGRYRAYFTLVYQCGLRLNEALQIKPKDIKGERLTLRVRSGKGGKSREVPISQCLLDKLRVFWLSHRNQEWLFPSASRGWKSSGISLREALFRSKKHMHSSSIWAAMKEARAETGLERKHEKVCTHTLRHSYATHMLEAGVSVRQVSAYLGHSSLKPTMVYLHLTQVSEAQAREALKTLPGV